MDQPDSIKLNIGCGNEKIPGYLGVDMLDDPNVDIKCNILIDNLPFEANSVDHVIMSHVIEHIQKIQHRRVLKEVHRVLKPNAEIFMAYPEFKVIAMNYINNYRGQAAYWEMTIYGRQASPGDFHVALMDTPKFVDVLIEVGFENIRYAPQEGAEFITLLKCSKGKPLTSREELINREVLHK